MSSQTSVATSTSSTMPQSTPSSSPPENTLNVFAQRLNNSAALCIEVGQYDRAIGSLQRALRLSEKYTNDRKGQSQTSRFTRKNFQECTLDGCIAFSDANSIFSKTRGNSISSIRRLTANVAASTTNSTADDASHENKRRRIELSSFEANKRTKNSNVDTDAETVSIPAHHCTEDDDDNNYYVYHRPIRVPQQCTEMGSVLFLIILFNLALAHHLKATTMSAVRNPNPSLSKLLSKTIDKSLMLYQLVVEYWSKLQQRLEANHMDYESFGNKTNNYSSIWFRMILHNNLGQIYKWTEKPTKEKECLEDLLSTVMLAIDQTIQLGQRNVAVPAGFQRDLEGFLSNAAALTQHERCAQAA